MGEMPLLALLGLAYGCRQSLCIPRKTLAKARSAV
jgi:hypothetical protein